MLLAVLDVRRGTRDADMLARGMAGDERSLRAADQRDRLDPDGRWRRLRHRRDLDSPRSAKGPTTRASASPCRRASAGAELKLRLDLSFGDPVEPRRIDYPTLLDDQGFSLLGYPLESVIAEKADTMMFLGDANTRDRDYGDVYLLSQIHPIEAEALRDALAASPSIAAMRCAPLGRFSKPCARAASSPGRHSAPAPACPACRSALPMLSMRSSTSSTGWRTGRLDLESGDPAVGIGR